MAGMKLRDYLKREKITAAAFAKRIGVTQSSVSRLCGETRAPDMGTVRRIHEETGGCVSAEDFFGVQRAPDRSDMRSNGEQ